MTSSSGVRAERPRRPGGRAAAVVARVRQATAELLDEVGYEALLLPEVAARAGVNKTTVYRRWPTKARLVAELMLAQIAEQDPGRDTGSLVGDLIAMLEDIARLLRERTTRAVLAVLVGGELDETARAARDAFWAERFQRGAAIVERAVARGELPAHTDARLLLEDAASPVYFRLAVTGRAVGRADLELFARRAAARAQLGGL
ncbi:TetR/AcrR family transcriptional regulator [Actinocorallia sp. API 0066]|uniref:TetR/AcrR family transcriptional regulator n=1 Tax=Actinocorallia sp. API 0066 TaxID=2896846 RepID=UPI001E4142A6|nr:TetR/AcrR family transcriptional regulator [Actinocorallia sp. API 0066]MCD0449293.1 TetR/AcrR family transcriptional regulator [Actinocorallia sp. API 0066]